VSSFVVRRWDVQPAPYDQAPPHVHERGDEAFCIVEGIVEVVLGWDRLTLGAGDHLVVPAGTRHTFAVPGPDPARLYAVMTEEIDALIGALHNPQLVAELGIDEVWRRYDSHVVE
jgi:uncharacterized cupin superfamily protein